MIKTINSEESNISSLVLDKGQADRLIDMYKSRDPADTLLAQNIIIKYNVEKSIYWIWYITCANISYKMLNLRTKLGRKFRDESELFRIADVSAERFSEFLIKKNWMTPEIYSYLYPNLLKILNKRISHPLYQFTIELKSEFKSLDKNDKPLTIHK